MNIPDIIFVDACIGLEITHTVDENTGEVEICARVFEPGIRCPIDFVFNLTFDTTDGSAGICVYL